MKLENFHERMQRVLLMSPLYRLERRRFKAIDGAEVSGLELGLITLLFFFEHMLDGRKKSGIRSLALFLQEQSNGQLFSAAEEYEKIAREIVGVFRPATGRRNEEEFYNWETHRADRVQYSYLKADKADMEANEQYYVLDEQGLELIFATKEYFNEFQLSINQLILRKQLEKGQFVLALRQIEEMRLDVETIHDRMLRIRQEIHRNIVSEDTLKRYRKIVADINLRLKGEEKEFLELKAFVYETRDRIRDNVDKDPERRAYANILEVERRLDRVHGAHRKLLQEGIELGTSALSAAEEALYFSGIDSFNFEQEITSRLFASPLPVTASRRLAEPFLSLELCQTWSPLSVFQPQRLDRLERESTQESFPDMEDMEASGEKLQNLREHYAKIIRYLLDFMAKEAETTLADFLPALEEKAPEICSNRQFYVLWLLLHRRGELRLDAESVGEKSVYSGIRQAVPELQSLRVVEIPGELEWQDFRISNMRIEVTLQDGV